MEIIALCLIVCIILMSISIIKTRLNLNKEEVGKIYLLTTSIISNYNDGSGLGPRVVTRYFLAKENKGKYYELFSNVLIKEKEANGGYFNTPCIEKIEPLTKYMKNPGKKTMEKKLLFDFLLELNTDEFVKTIVSKEKANDNEENL